MRAHRRVLVRASALVSIVAGSVAVLSAATPAIDTDVVAEGEIVVEPGQALPDDGVLFAWPANEVLATLQVGDQVSMDPVGTVSIDEDGSFEAVITSADGLDDYASNFGEVNLYMSADNGQVEFGEGFAIELTGDATVDLGVVEETGDITVTSADNPPAEVYAEKTCTTTKIADLGTKWIPVGGLFSTNSGTTVDYQYSKGQSTSLGTSVSEKASNAGFSASGTVSVSSTATVDFPTASGTTSKLAETQFRFGTFDTYCWVIEPGYSYESHKYTVRADLWVGGSTFVSASTPSATYCVSYLKGSSFTKDSSKQVTWTGAATFYGVGLSAQTGWSTNGKLVYGFPGKAGKLCGSGGYATESSTSQIVAK